MALVDFIVHLNLRLLAHNARVMAHLSTSRSAAGTKNHATKALMHGLSRINISGYPDLLQERLLSHVDGVVLGRQSTVRGYKECRRPAFCRNDASERMILVHVRAAQAQDSGCAQ
jgi:hypothetical protein